MEMILHKRERRHAGIVDLRHKLSIAIVRRKIPEIEEEKQELEDFDINNMENSFADRTYQLHSSVPI